MTVSYKYRIIINININLISSYFIKILNEFKLKHLKNNFLFLTLDIKFKIRLLIYFIKKILNSQYSYILRFSFIKCLVS